MSEDCNVCDNAALLQKATCDEKTFRYNILKTLCYLTEVLTVDETELTPASVILPQVTIQAAVIQSTYGSFATIGLIDTTKQLKKIRILNVSDSDLDFSYDGGTNVAFTVPANSPYEDDINLTLAAMTSLVMRRSGGMSASFGKVLIEGRY